MSETTDDICYVKFLSTELLTPVANDATQGVWGTYEIVNIGTAPTDGEHSVTAFICHSGAQWKYQTRDLDDPVLEANGGSYKGTVHFPMDQLPWPGQWTLAFQVNRGVAQGISDSVDHTFTVEHQVQH